jgi:hypothetical protein
MVFYNEPNIEPNIIRNILTKLKISAPILKFSTIEPIPKNINAIIELTNKPIPNPRAVSFFVLSIFVSFFFIIIINEITLIIIIVPFTPALGHSYLN